MLRGMKTINHDKNEPPRPLKGEEWFVTIGTIVVISSVLFGLRFVFDYSHTLFIGVCVLIAIVCLLVALRMDAKR
jgi:hypothetical protein